MHVNINSAYMPQAKREKEGRADRPHNGSLCLKRQPKTVYHRICKSTAESVTIQAHELQTRQVKLSAAAGKRAAFCT